MQNVKGITVKYLFDDDLVEVTLPGEETRRISMYELSLAATQDERDLRAVYRDLYEAAQRDKTRARADRAVAEAAERSRRLRACFGHRVVREEGPYGFTSPVAFRAEDQNRAAHGNVMFVEHCRCGALRKRLVNGRHEEIGEWQ